MRRWPAPYDLACIGFGHVALGLDVDPWRCSSHPAALAAGNRRSGNSMKQSWPQDAITWSAIADDSSTSSAHLPGATPVMALAADQFGEPHLESLYGGFGNGNRCGTLDHRRAFAAKTGCRAEILSVCGHRLPSPPRNQA